MSETVKKASAKPKAPAKPRKTAASKKAAAENGTHSASTNGAPNNVTQMKLSHDQVAQLAHRYWAERGHKHGHHEEDWLRAEQELSSKAS
jgi:Protein of unknown function (DUF2934)